MTDKELDMMRFQEMIVEIQKKEINWLKKKTEELEASNAELLEALEKKDVLMADYIYRYTCKGCGAIREVVTLRELTKDQKRHVRNGFCPSCELKRIMKGEK